MKLETQSYDHWRKQMVQYRKRKLSPMELTSGLNGNYSICNEKSGFSKEWMRLLKKRTSYIYTWKVCGLQ